MRLTLVAVGRARGSPAQPLFEDYAARLAPGPWGPLRLKEVEEKGAFAGAERQTREARKIRDALPKGACLVCLDEKGETLGSVDFADRMQRFAEAGKAELAFVIGGADGLDPTLLAEARWRLSLGAMTWPHLLVRALLAEQLFRAQSILAGHPYHRG